MKKGTVVIILAGGAGSRFSNEVPKQLVKIAGKTLLEHTVEKFEHNTNIDKIIIVANPHFFKDIKLVMDNRKFAKIKAVIKGGVTRQESSFLGLKKCDPKTTKYVLFHDAVRPFISDRIINDILLALKKNKAVDVAIPPADTLIKVSKDRFIESIPERSGFMRGQTPQGFDYKTILKAHNIAHKNKDYDFTDDCGIVLKYGFSKVYVVEGSEENMKVTNPLDIHIADKLFQLRNTYMEANGISPTKLKGKKIIIFGHSSGIGREIYKLCIENGAKVIGYSLSTGYDIRDRKLINKTLNTFVKKNGKIDILISTTGILKIDTLEKFTEENIIDQIEVNYISQIFLAKMAIKYMVKKSSIALFTSSSYTRGRANYSIYSSTKAAIVNFVQGVAEEIFEKEIRINAISPTRANTPMRKENFGKETKRSLLDPKDIAIVTLNTCMSDLTGQVIDVR